MQSQNALKWITVSVVASCLDCSHSDHPKLLSGSTSCPLTRGIDAICSKIAGARMEETSDPIAVLNVNLVGGAKGALSTAAAFCFVALGMDLFRWNHFGSVLPHKHHHLRKRWRDCGKIHIRPAPTMVNCPCLTCHKFAVLQKNSTHPDPHQFRAARLQMNPPGRSHLTTVQAKQHKHTFHRPPNFAWDAGDIPCTNRWHSESHWAFCSATRRLSGNEMSLDENNLWLDRAAGQALRCKANFTTAGRDPCLAEGFAMKTLVPNIDQMNDVSPPDDDNESVDTEVRAHDFVEKVPHLPDISSSVVRRAVGTHARFITNSCLRTMQRHWDDLTRIAQQDGCICQKAIWLIWSDEINTKCLSWMQTALDPLSNIEKKLLAIS